MREGERRAVEYLPNGGVLFMVAHDDGQICKWAEYTSMQSMARPKKKNKGATPTYIKCPRCKKQGRLNWAYNMQASKEDRPFTFNYIMVHEPIQGLWGKTKETKRRRRCQSFTPDERVQILKQVGRYIADPPIPGPKQTALIPEKRHKDEERLGAKMIEGGAQSNQEPIQHKGPVFFPSGKRLTTCTTCKKPGYKYKTYFQHSNEPPIGPRMLKGKQDGWRYRRCSFTKGKVKQVQVNASRLIGSASEQIASRQTISGESSQGNIVKKLESYIEENGSDLIKENDSTRDYREMYWDLIDNLRKIVDQGSGVA